MRRRQTNKRTAPRRDSVTPRGWLVIAGGAATSAVVLTAWLPVGALLSQSSQLSAATTRLNQLSHEGRTLAAESKRLATPEEQARLAREEYQLVAPGQRLIQVLAPSGAPSGKSSSGPFPGDPGLSAPVVPGGSAVVPSTPGAHKVRAATTTHTTASTNFFSRVVAAFEFWR